MVPKSGGSGATKSEVFCASSERAGGGSLSYVDVLLCCLVLRGIVALRGSKQMIEIHSISDFRERVAKASLLQKRLSSSC